MICETLRDVLVDLAQRGKLIRVLKTVDLTWELVCLVKWMFQAVEEQNRCRMGKLGVQFEMFRGFPVKATDQNHRRTLPHHDSLERLESPKLAVLIT